VPTLNEVFVAMMDHLAMRLSRGRLSRVRRPARGRAIPFALLLCFAAAFAITRGAPYVLGPEDVLDVKVFQYDKLNARVTIGEDGTILYPMLGRIKAAGLTTSALEAALRERLADGILKDPEVVVSIAQYASKKVIVIGAARQTGVIPIRRSIPLIELIAQVEPTEEASGDINVIKKKPDGTQETYRISWTNILAGEAPDSMELTDGDVVIVVQGSGAGLGKAWVFGEVMNGGVIPVGPGLSLREVILRCGGKTSLASGEIVIHRSERDKPKSGKAAAGEAEAENPAGLNSEDNDRADARQMETDEPAPEAPEADDAPRMRPIAVTRSEIYQFNEIMRGRQQAIVRPGDSVEVKSTAEGTFYIIGLVRKTGSFPLKRGMTVLEAVAAAGGYDRLGDPKRQVIFRKIGGKLLEIEAKDSTPLMPNDILKVPEAWF